MDGKEDAIFPNEMERALLEEVPGMMSRFHLEPESAVTRVLDRDRLGRAAGLNIGSDPTRSQGHRQTG